MGNNFQKITSTTDSAPATLLLVRLLVGSVFLSEGIQKFLFSDSLGAGRFMKIGIPAPELMAPFVGAVETIGGILLILGFLSRPAAFALFINISVAIVTTKIPMLLHDGFWKMAHEARTDWCMFLGSLAILIAGAGRWSIDRMLTRKITPQTP